MTARSTNSRRKRVRFEVRAEPGSRVCLAGSFNNWDPEQRLLKDKEGNGRFAASLLLAPGTYQYKFVIDGAWMVDPSCDEWAPNEMGSLNSVIHVG